MGVLVPSGLSTGEAVGASGLESGATPGGSGVAGVVVAGITSVGRAAERNTNPTVPVHLAGDIGIVAAQKALGDTPTIEAGWTLIDSEPSGRAFAIWWKELDGSDTFPTLGNVTENDVRAIHVFRGVDTTTPINVQGVGGTDTWPALTTTVDGCMMVMMGCGNAHGGFSRTYADAPINLLVENSPAVTPVGSYIEGSGVDNHLQTAEGLIPTAGLSTGGRWTSGSGNTVRTIGFALAPA